MVITFLKFHLNTHSFSSRNRFFKSALNEQAEEWGTHNKLLSTKGKTLRQTIPKGFSYFNIEWNDGGFAQIIETNSFPKDFSLDTIAGMYGCHSFRSRACLVFIK